MRWVLTLLVGCLAVRARADHIILIPLDSRPAAGQFAQMIGKIAACDVTMPPYDDLGRFTSPGKSDRILDWLASQDLHHVTAVIASADMVAYGGLIASRTPETAYELAIKRLDRLVRIVKNSGAKLYVSSATMRLAPTATRVNRLWRDKMTKYLALRNVYDRTKDAGTRDELHRLLSYIPPKDFDDYIHTRRRDHSVQLQLVKMAANKRINYLVIGQDDAQPFGPHVPEGEELRAAVAKNNAQVSVYFSEGIDQHANLLVSRALLRASDFLPRVRVVYSDAPLAADIADFESKPLKQSVVEQILASGARPADANSSVDYTLFVNVANPSKARFERFRYELSGSIDSEQPTAVADVNLASDGTADERVFNLLYNKSRMLKVLSYAGWNTAGNTLGTSIPMANVYLLARKFNVDPVAREVAHKEFLLHRFVDDYAYHKFVRPEAYKILVERTGVKEEAYGRGYDEATQVVRRDLAQYLMTYFRDQFSGRQVDAVTFTGLSDVRVWLPWPRAYEVRLEFRLSGEATPRAYSATRH